MNIPIQVPNFFCRECHDRLADALTEEPGAKLRLDVVCYRCSLEWELWYDEVTMRWNVVGEKNRS